MTETPAAEPQPERGPLPALVTPCHGVPLSIYTRHESSSYYGQDVVDEVVCSADGCHNSWNPDGTVASSFTWDSPER